MVGNNLKETQLQQIVDKTILLYDKVDLNKMLLPFFKFRIFLWNHIIILSKVNHYMEGERRPPHQLTGPNN